MANQKTKESVRQTKKEPGWHVVPGVKPAAKKNRRQRDKNEIRDQPANGTSYSSS